MPPVPLKNMDKGQLLQILCHSPKHARRDRVLVSREDLLTKINGNTPVPDLKKFFRCKVCGSKEWVATSPDWSHMAVPYTKDYVAPYPMFSAAMHKAQKKAPEE